MLPANASMHRLFLATIFVLGLGLMRPGAMAADEIQTRALRFAKGASYGTVNGSLQGRQTIDYTLRARGGQTMSVTLTSRHAGLAFNVLPPGSKDVAIADAIMQQSWSGTLPSDGQYTVRTYLPRSAARRNEKAAFRLTVAIADGSAAARRAGEGRFDATGKIPCALHPSHPMGVCDFGVARAGGGTATVVVTRPDGRKRMLAFSAGRAIGADSSQANGNVSFSATRRSDLQAIQVGDERYEVPDAVVFGG